MENTLQITMRLKDEATEQLKRAVNNVNQSFNEAQKSSNFFASALEDIGKIAAGIGLAKLAGEAINFSKAMIGAGINTASFYENAKIRLETFLKDSAKAQEFLNQIKKDAMKTPFDTRALVDTVSLLISAGEKADDARKVVLALGNAVLATGGGNAELQRLAVNLQQIKNVGQASALDIKQFAYAGINIYSLLNKETQKHVQYVAGEQTKAYQKAQEQTTKYSNRIQEMSLQLQELESKGKGSSASALRLRNRISEMSLELEKARNTAGEYAGRMIEVAQKNKVAGVTYEEISKALLQSMEKGGLYYGAMEKTAGTYQQRLSNLKEAMDVFFADVLTKTGVFDLLKNSMAVLTDFLNNNKDNVSNFFITIINGINSSIPFIQSFFNVLKNILSPAIQAIQNAFNVFSEVFAQLKEVFTPIIPELMMLAFIIGVILAGAITIFVSVLFGLITAVANVIGAVIRFFGGLIQFIIGFFEILVGIFTFNLNTIKMGWDNMVNGIIETLVGFVLFAIGLIEGFVNGIINFFQILYKVLVGGSIIPDLVNAIILWFNHLFNLGTTIISNLKNSLINTWNSIKTSIQNIVDSFVNYIVSKFDNFYNHIVNVKNRILDLFRNLANGITSALRSIKFPHLSIGEGSITIMGKEIKYPKLNVDWYEKGGWVKNTGLAMVHAGEYVLSKDMLAGRQPVGAPVYNYSNSYTPVVNAVINTPIDLDYLAYKLSWQLRNG